MTYLPGRIVPADSTAADILLLASYALLGGRVIITALRNLFKGEVFDENFLMTLATAGAVAIHEIPEAAGVMLFYRIGEYLEDRASDRSRKQIMDAVDMRPETVTRTRGGETEVIPAGEAQIGDILMIRAENGFPWTALSPKALHSWIHPLSQANRFPGESSPAIPSAQAASTRAD